ncbi:MAG: Asp-tRNA(Asn)/Glu-tRNA(Gln) amidotransferase subunit GatC [Verrucomicrobiales bacterium]|nr:Asp-tRNA(Asn)/Glu-tRNA(Gln) amidotransferase subunit GatC [Verrucomicrobiales bacterium]
MAGTDFDIQYIAHLARLDLTEEEQRQLGAQLQQVLGYMDKLKEPEVGGVEPMAHALPRSNVFREDAVRPSLPHEEALRNAPARANGLFVVPKIVE